MDAAWLTAIGGIVLGLLSFMVAIGTQRSAASKQELESLRETITHLQVENSRLVKRLDDLEFENGALKDWAEALVCQVREMGGVPVRFEEKTRPRE
jgi:regulator of replication initiation timing